MPEDFGGEGKLTLTDAEASQFGFAPPPATTPEPAATAATADAIPQPDKAGDPAVKPAEQVAATPPPETKTPPAPAGKVPYTADEIKAILAMDKPSFDLERMTPEMQVIRKSFDVGFTPKLELAARMREEADRKFAEIKRLETEKAEREIFVKEAEELGEQQAETNRKLRALEAQVAETRGREARAQQEYMTMKLAQDYRAAAPAAFIPQDAETAPAWEDFVMAQKWANDVVRAQNGQPPLTMEEAVRGISDTIGLTNPANMRRLIKANPAVYNVIRDEIIAEHTRAKAAGPVVVSSSSAPIAPPVQKPAGTTQEAFIDRVKRDLGVAPGEEIILK